MKTFNAICCECQRMIVNGAVFTNGEFVMRYHPSIAVSTAVDKIEDWEKWFSQEHQYCLGSNSVPQWIDKSNSKKVNSTWF